MTHALSAGLPNLVDKSLEEASELENDTASTTSETAKQDDLRAAEFKRTHIDNFAVLLERHTNSITKRGLNS